MSDLTITELRVIAKNRNIKGYRGLSKDELLTNLNISGLSFTELKLIIKTRRINNYGDLLLKNQNLLKVLKKKENKIVMKAK